VAVKAQTGANGRGGAHPQDGREAEPERSERLARSPAGADTAAGAASRTAREERVEGTTRTTVGRDQGSEPASETGADGASCEVIRDLGRGLRGDCFDAVASIRLYR
jgi:hypothetical protein